MLTLDADVGFYYNKGKKNRRSHFLYCCYHGEVQHEHYMCLKSFFFI